MARVTLISPKVRWKIFPGVNTIRLRTILLAVTPSAVSALLALMGGAKDAELSQVNTFSVINILRHHINQTADY